MVVGLLVCAFLCYDYSQGHLKNPALPLLLLLLSLLLLLFYFFLFHFG